MLEKNSLLAAEGRKYRQQWAQFQRGFTLIELLVVLVILGMLAAITTPQVLRYLGRAKTDTAHIEIKNIATALDLFRIDFGRYPTQQEGLAALATNSSGSPAWRGPYIENKTSLNDPWGYPYHYRIPGEHGPYDLYSLGADNAPGGTGEDEDVTNW